MSPPAGSSIWGRKMGLEVGTQEVPDTSGFERSGRLKVLELEEDTAVCCCGFELAFSMAVGMRWAGY